MKSIEQKYLIVLVHPTTGEEVTFPMYSTPGLANILKEVGQARKALKKLHGVKLAGCQFYEALPV
jgi:hypothetical protein